MAFFNKKNTEKDDLRHEEPLLPEHPVVTPPLMEAPPSPAETAPQPGTPEMRQGAPETHEAPPPTEPTAVENTLEGLRNALKKSKRPAAPKLPIVRDELTKQVEKIMEDGLVDAFKKMTPVQQQQFKIKGEETAGQIRQLLKHTRVKIKKIFKLLMAWLKLIPGVNKFFLEQEAKIKAERILRLKEVFRNRT